MACIISKLKQVPELNSTQIQPIFNIHSGDCLAAICLSLQYLGIPCVPGQPGSPPRLAIVDTEQQFEPLLLNSPVYIISPSLSRDLRHCHQLHGECLLLFTSMFMYWCLHGAVVSTPCYESLGSNPCPHSWWLAKLAVLPPYSGWLIQVPGNTWKYMGTPKDIWGYLRTSGNTIGYLGKP